MDKPRVEKECIQIRWDADQCYSGLRPNTIITNTHIIPSENCFTYCKGISKQACFFSDLDHVPAANQS